MTIFVTYENYKTTGRLVEILCTPTPEEWYPEKVKTGIGGSEEAVINISKELMRLGYRVIVYNTCGDKQGWNGLVDWWDCIEQDN